MALPDGILNMGSSLSIVVGLLIIMLLLITRARSPLNHLPGPWHTKHTDLRLKLATILGQRMHYIHALHKTYGAVVRIAPDTADICDVEGFKQIHSVTGGFKKTPWYHAFAMLPRMTAFSIIDEKQHLDRRRLLSRPFTKSALRQDWEATVHDKARAVVEKMRQDASRGPVDVMKWWSFYSQDVIAHLSFGESFHQIESGKTNAYIDAIQSTVIGGAITAELPWLGAVLKRIPLPFFRKFFNPGREIHSHAQLAIDNMHENSTSKNIFSKIHDGFQGGNINLDEQDIISEASGLIIAGSDTTAVNLTYLIYIILSSPELQAQLEAEVGNLPEDFADKDLESLELLNSVLNETLRLYGAASGGLPRVVPSGGQKFCGYFIPEGAVVSTQAWSLHRMSSAFPEPEEFDPGRWIVSDGKMSDDAKAIYNPFGAGSRTCIGQHLTLTEMRLGIAEFFRECKGAYLDTSTTKESMEPVNYFIVVPKTRRCNVRLPGKLEL